MGCRNRDHRMHSLVTKTFSSLHRLHFFSRGYPLLLLSINKIPRMADIVFSLHLSSPSFFASIAHHCYTEISSPSSSSSSSNTNCNVFQVFLPLRCHCARPSFARPTSHSLDVVGPCCFWKLPQRPTNPARVPSNEVPTYLSPIGTPRSLPLTASTNSGSHFPIPFNECFTPSNTNTTKKLRSQATYGLLEQQENLSMPFFTRLKLGRAFVALAKRHPRRGLFCFSLSRRFFFLQCA